MALVVKNLPADAGDVADACSVWVGKIPWRRKRQPAPVSLPGKFHGQRSLAGYSPWGHKESDTTDHHRFIILFSKKYIKKKTQNNKESIFNLTVQYLGKHSNAVPPPILLSSTSCVKLPSRLLLDTLGLK